MLHSSANDGHKNHAAASALARAGRVGGILADRGPHAQSPMVRLRTISLRLGRSIPLRVPAVATMAESARTRNSPPPTHDHDPGDLRAAPAAHPRDRGGESDLAGRQLGGGPG